MENKGGRLNLGFGKEIKGKNWRDKKKSFRKREGLFFGLKNPEETREEKKSERKLKEKRERWGSKLIKP